jgi:hypothetical protein
MLLVAKSNKAEEGHLVFSAQVMVEVGKEAVRTGLF